MVKEAVSPPGVSKDGDDIREDDPTPEKEPKKRLPNGALC